MPIPDTVDSSPNNPRNLSSLWGGPFVMGLLITLLGIVALAWVGFTSVVSVFYFGAMLVVAGIFEIVHAFRVRKTGPFLMFLLGGILSIVVGALVWSRPGAGLAALTLLIAGYFFASGLFRGITSIADRYTGWGWDVAYGIVSVVLGVIIFAQFPASSLYVVGLLVGVEILSRGLSIMAGSLAIRRVTRRVHA